MPLFAPIVFVRSFSLCLECCDFIAPERDQFAFQYRQPISQRGDLLPPLLSLLDHVVRAVQIGAEVDCLADPFDDVAPAGPAGPATG